MSMSMSPNNLTIETVKEMLATGGRPAPGRCFVHLDRKPGQIGSIHIPEVSRDMRITDTLMSGTVLAVTPSRVEVDRGDVPEFAAGDRVLLLLYDEDRDREVIITRNEVISAVVG